MRVVVLGASGYVGGRLIPSLLEAGHSVRAITRQEASLRDYPWRAQVDVVEANVLDPATLPLALADCDAAYYLIHSMGRDDFEEVDQAAASNFVAAANDSPLQRIVYLGGLGSGDLSPHLASRQEVGRILADGSVPVTEFRAAVVIGSGSLSFEMTRYLTEVLPAMVTPSWVTTKVQPIAIRDVVTYLLQALEVPESAGRIIEIGGADVITYEETMQRYARGAGLRRRLIVRVPVLSLGLSARWVGLVTPLSNEVASQLIGSLKHEVVVTDDTAQQLFPFEPMGYDEAVQRAIEKTRGADIPTRWIRGTWQPADPLPSDPSHAFGTVFSDRREVTSSAAPGDVARALMRVGGATGYYSVAWAWRIRGLIDSVFGGVGLRRGRRHPDTVNVGEPLDFWRVVRTDPEKSLELKAEMRIPGEAWLSWEVEPESSGSRLVQTAWFTPRGLFGRLYWYLMFPFHAVIFPRMARGIVRAAEERVAGSA